MTALAYSLSLNSPILLARFSMSAKSGQEVEDAQRREATGRIIPSL